MCPIIAPSNYVWDGSSSRSTHAAVCEVMWWVWIIRLVAEQLCPFMTVALLTSAFKDPTMLKHNAIVFFIKFTIFLSILILPLFGFANISCQISYINKVLLDLTSIFIKNIFAIGECCVALRSVTGASDQFETFLSHRGEEMGSIRGRVRVHVPKDKQATREKIYGGSHETGLLLTSALLALSLPTKPSSPSSVTFFDSCEFHIASSIWFLNDPWLGFTLAGIYRLLPLLAPDWLTRCILRQDRWVLCHQVRHNTHNNNSLWPNHPKQT